MSLPSLENQLIDDVADLYGNEFLSDFVLSTSDGRSFRVHKLILAARSEVFRTMFKNEDSKENRTGECVVTDVAGSTLEALLYFMYGVLKSYSDFEAVSINAQELLVAADKYNIRTVKLLCAKVLKKSIDGENVADILILAHRYYLTELKTAALHFIWKDIKEFLRAGHLETVRVHSATLAEDVLDQVFAIDPHANADDVLWPCHCDDLAFE